MRFENVVGTARFLGFLRYTNTLKSLWQATFYSQALLPEHVLTKYGVIPDDQKYSLIFV